MGYHKKAENDGFFAIALLKNPQRRTKMYCNRILIYDYMAFKKGKWNLETDKNVKAAINYFKELPIPVSMADFVTEINMDGADEICMNIAPEWDGENDRIMWS